MFKLHYTLHNLVQSTLHRRYGYVSSALCDTQMCWFPLCALGAVADLHLALNLLNCRHATVLELYCSILHIQGKHTLLSQHSVTIMTCSNNIHSCVSVHQWTLEENLPYNPYVGTLASVGHHIHTLFNGCTLSATGFTGIMRAHTVFHYCETFPHAVQAILRLRTACHSADKHLVHLRGEQEDSFDSVLYQHAV